MNWNDAKDYCRNLSSSESQLRSGNSGRCEQLGDIHQHILLEYSPLWHWIGGTDSYEESDWHWLTGGTVPVSTPFWYPGHPLLNTTLNCLALQQFTGYFFDYSCTSHGPFICEEFSVAT
nr:C-type lectin domain family 17, member A-like [Cherax quadricarinatus]